MEDYFEDPSDLRINPLKEGEVDAEQGIQLSSLNTNNVHETNQAQEDQGEQAMINQIYSLFLYSNQELDMALHGLILVVLKTSYG